jgi:glycosyltransferase involved in cell wall biosynthesis
MDDGTRLIIAGKPWKDRFDDYARIISDQGLTDRVVPIIRFIEDEERTLLFIAADVNVLPYRTIYQSGVLLMAMSHGLPVIASDLPANREVIEAGVNGLLFESERPEALAEQVNRFFEDSALQKRMGERAIETISREYDWNTIAGEYRQFIAQGRRDR